ncbi:MAG: alpha/beta hydrolase [Oscillospiraceae bacterium]|nr:alpha/beta hydrolase [Oscillospiraceae bacterium]
MRISYDRIFHIIDGGNHSQFGSYGLQRSDNEPEISMEQIDETVKVVSEAFHE